MKKFVLLFLLLAETTISFAQIDQHFFYYIPPQPSETLFNNPKPFSSNAIFSFRMPKGNKVVLEMKTLQQLRFTPNLDSLFADVQQHLKLLQDSLKNDGIVRRMDYVPGFVNNTKVRIINHTEKATNYSFQNNELVNLKVDSDTLRIAYTTKTGRKVNFWKDGEKSKVDDYSVFVIMFIVNNFSEIENIPSSVLSQCIALLRKDFEKEINNPSEKTIYNYTGDKYIATYDLTTNKLVFPTKTKWIKNRYTQTELVPNIYFGSQFARGSFVPSAAVGLRFTFSKSYLTNNHLFLMWQPYFFFSKDINNNSITHRNDFLTLHFIELEKKRQESFGFVSNASFGYLIRKQGNWFEENTFKIGLPGVRSGWLQLEPELFFNNFFKNFSPSLKLTLHYE